MVFGIGTDILEIDRIRVAISGKSGERFLQKCFTAREMEMYRKSGFRVESLTGGFCAKEAVVKSVGTGFGAIGLRDVEILRDERGCPEVFFSKEAREFLKELGIGEVKVSISHCKEYATASAVATAKKGND